MKRSIAKIVAGGSVLVGLVIGDFAEARYIPCEEFAGHLFENLKDKNFYLFKTQKGLYGLPGFDRNLISSHEYDKCLIKNFEKKAPGYSIKVIREDPEHFNGTTYQIVKKEEPLLGN